MKVALVARSVFPLHGYGGLERHVYDLARALAERDVAVTLITRPPADGQEWSPESIAPSIQVEFVPYRTFPGAGRRGTTVIDRSTAYPLFGLRAGRRALELVRRGEADIVHGLGASVLGYARARLRARHDGSGASAGQARVRGGHDGSGASAGQARVRGGHDGSGASAGQARVRARGDGSGAAAGQAATAPLVLNPQGLEEFGATDPARAPLKLAAYFPLRKAVLACAAAADAVIATDKSLEPVVLQHLGIPREKMRTIPNALDLRMVDALIDPALAGELRRKHGLAIGDRVLLSVGRLEASKGFHVLLRALGALRDHGGLEGRPWRWVVLGDGPYRPMLEMLAEELDLQKRILFLGRVADHEMHAWHELSTLFVHPTLYEGSSLVTLEAMAHRRAVIASSAGGIPDKVHPGENGWLVTPGDASALAAAISGALADPARLAHYGLAGRAIVEREFSWTAAGDATVALYRELLGRNRSRE
jgi:glycosyltransferase involved in cell wall biosynthesis